MWTTLLLAFLLQALVDDFEDRDFQAASGLSWMVLADVQIGGASTGRLAPVAGAPGSEGALRLEGEIRDGFVAPFAGVWVPLDSRGFLRDLSAFRGIRFRARASGPGFLVGFRRVSGGQGANFMGEIASSASWSTFEIAFDELTQKTPASSPVSWSPDGIGFLGFQSAFGHEGAFWLELDDVELVERNPAPPQSRTIQVSLTPRDRLAGLDWKRLAEDASGDGRFSALPEARALSYATDGELVWFRIDLAVDAPEDFFGVNVAVDGDGDPSNGLSWWGFNGAFRFDRLVSVYLTKVGERYQGVVGVTDADGASRFELTNLGSGNVAVVLDESGPAIAVGVRRSEIDADGRFRAIATVGSAFLPNDDVPNEGYAEVTLEK